jgi:two-component system NarL family sensor kinase
MIQECLQNILKHAEATTFSIHLGYEEMQLCISIQDNGKGFNLEEALAKKNGIGLSNIQSRSSLIGAMVGFESQPGNGTTISIKLPYD